jgi:regulatory protein
VTLADASSFFVSKRVWETAPFYEGDEIAATRWQTIVAESLYHQTYHRALDLLARSEHSRFLLHQKLRQREFPEEQISRALDELEDAGYLDDSRFAMSWVRSRLRGHPEGPRVLIGRLRERGVSAATAENAVQRILHNDPEMLRDGAQKVVDKLKRRRSPTREQAEDLLFKRGFDRSTIRQVLEENADLPISQAL